MPMTNAMRQPTTRPSGIAIRGGGFEALKDRCAHVAPSAMTRIDLDRAIAQGTPELSAGARCLLTFYASHLSLENTKCTAVFPGTDRATSCLGVSPATVRRHKVELENAGYVIRCYDKRNRPLEGGAIDLRPLLIAVPEIIARLNAEQEQRRAQWKIARAPEPESELSTQVLNSAPLNCTKKSSENSSFNQVEEGRGGCDRVSQHQSPGTTSDHELIAKVLASSPKLRSALPDDFDPTSPSATSDLRSVLPELFPSESPTSIGHTGLWAEQRLGSSMFAAIAIAVEDPDVRRPASYFGRLVTRAEGYDPTENLKRLVELNPLPIVVERHNDPLADGILDQLVECLGPGPAASWFAPGRTQFNLCDKTLVVETRSAIAATRIRNDYSDVLLRCVHDKGVLRIDVRQKTS